MSTHLISIIYDIATANLQASVPTLDLRNATFSWNPELDMAKKNANGSDKASAEAEVAANSDSSYQPDISSNMATAITKTDDLETTTEASVTAIMAKAVAASDNKTIANTKTNTNTDALTFSLSNITFAPSHPAELIAVVGAVGSGKSTFLSSLLNEVPLISGSCVNSLVVGHSAYCAQTPWIQNKTVKENVLFGVVSAESIEDNGNGVDSIGDGMKETETNSSSSISTSSLHRNHYKTAVSSAALLPDLQILPVGEETEIGEKVHLLFIILLTSFLVLVF
jgi:ABC-type multidrug transport system fused ATPase/permease subunit